MSSLLQHLQATQTGTLRCSLPKLKPKIFLAPYQQMVTCVRQSMGRSHAISKVLILYINSIIVWSDLGITGIEYLVSIWVHPYSIQHSTVQSSQVYLLAKSGILDSIVFDFDQYSEELLSLFAGMVRDFGAYSLWFWHCRHHLLGGGGRGGGEN